VSARSGGAAERPVFAVLGHPNKGKSSLVATLAHDERVRVAPEPGTTTRSDRYPMRLDGEILYELVDTPGFQRARAALAWMQREAERTGASAADRRRVVARFCEEPEHATRFPDEVELLRPVLEGAGILYVVDGAVPFASEYEAEMEILRWTGRPSLAVINPIGRPRYVDAWQAALGQYFKVVRVLDALRADFAVQLDLLRAFGELEERWRAPLRRAVEALEADRARRRERAAREIAHLLARAAQLVVERRLRRDEDPEQHRASLEERYKGKLRRLERRCRRAVEEIYDFSGLEFDEPEDVERETEHALLEDDLFSERSWLAFGLRKRDLAAAGAAAGATAGGAVDVALSGTSFLAGAALGGVVGGALAWWGGDRLGRLEVLRQPLGGTLVRYGPARGTNLAFVLLGRARLHHALVAGRTHARRDRPVLRPEDAGEQAHAVPALERGTTRRLLDLLRRSGGPPEDELAREVEELL